MANKPSDSESATEHKVVKPSDSESVTEHKVVKFLGAILASGTAGFGLCYFLLSHQLLPHRVDVVYRDVGTLTNVPALITNTTIIVSNTLPVIFSNSYPVIVERTNFIIIASNGIPIVSPSVPAYQLDLSLVTESTLNKQIKIGDVLLMFYITTCDYNLYATSACTGAPIGNIKDGKPYRVIDVLDAKPRAVTPKETPIRVAYRDAAGGYATNWFKYYPEQVHTSRYTSSTIQVTN